MSEQRNARMSWERHQTVGPVTALYVAPPLKNDVIDRLVLYAGIGPDVIMISALEHDWPT